MRKPFLVGKATAGTTEVVVLAPREERPFPGPWILRGLVDVRGPVKLPA